MKSFQNIVAVACTLASLSFANAGAITSASASPTKVHSTARTSSGSASPTAVATSSPTIVTMSSSILPPTSTPSNGIGGFVVTGIYTTCLTVTFSDAASSTATSLPTTSVVEGSTSTFVTPTASVEADVKRQAITSSTVLDSESTSTSIAIATSSSFPGGDVAVFTTCLVFLPTANATATGFPAGGATSTVVASSTFGATTIVSESAAASTA